MTSEIKVDTISEQTSGNGITIDGLTIKDGNIQGSPALVGTTPSFTIGDGGAEDAKLVFDGNAVDFVVGLDDSADEFRIGVGSGLGSDRVFEINSSGVSTFQKAVHFAGSVPTVTIGDGGAEDAKIVFDGNAVDYYIALDDSADNLIIGSGSTVGSNSLITIDSNGDLDFDVSGNIKLDADDAGEIRFLDGGTQYAAIKKDGNNALFQSIVADGDFIIQGIDGSSFITALTLDMSDSGMAHFNNYIKVSNRVVGSDSLVLVSSDSNEKIQLDASGFIKFETAGAEGMRIDSSGKVGIGISSPNQLLTLKKDQNTDTAVRVANGTGGTAARSSIFLDVDSGGAQLMAIDDGFSTSGAYIADNVTFVSDTAMANGMTIGTRASDSSAHLRFYTQDSESMRIFGSGTVSIGTTDAHGKLTVMTASSGAGANGDADELQLEGSGNAGMTICSGTSSSGNIHFADVHAANRGILTYDHSADQMKFGVAGTIRARFTSSGEFLAGKSSAGIANTGVELHTDKLSATVSNATVMYLNRLLGDGKIAQFHQAGTEEGSIEVSGSTISYNGFTGTHWSRLADNSKPTILRGTIMESIDEMCDWYQAVADVPEVLWTADDPETQDVLWTEDDELPSEDVEVGDVRETATQTVGDVKEEAYTVKESIVLGDKSVGDSITFTSNTSTGDGKEYTGTIVKEDDVKHTKSKVSDTADSKKVYGVFSNWDDADDGQDGDVNDMNIAQVGTFIIRVNADVTVEAGDLLVSNGDGTAKLQDDDIIRSKTVAKVNSNIKVETYSDGSYTVPCTLHC
jgi:hypothetical protein